MRKKINVIVGTNNFGLGPVGKVSSIVNQLKNDFSFYACGNSFDISIFPKNSFKDKLFSKNKRLIQKFVKKYDIHYAIVVLDVELARILLSMDVKVLFVDSLPFMWTQADIDEGLLPLDATVYCAQKCIQLTDNSKQVLSQIENLEWINPIQNYSDSSFVPFSSDYVHINVGGLHSPIGNGESYIYTVIVPLVKLFYQRKQEVVITCGSSANKIICGILEKMDLLSDSLKVLTLTQNDFLSSVEHSNLFLTSPGLTTIYETSSLNKPTIILPPQNLSQFYNLEYSKKILSSYKTINWETEKLCFHHLDSIIPMGETYVVEQIYQYITDLVSTSFPEDFQKRFSHLLDQKYLLKEESDFSIEGNGVEDIRRILYRLIEKDKRKIFLACPISKYLEGDGLNPEFESFIRELYRYCQNFSSNVFMALEREKYGKNKMYGSDCTVADFNEMKESDLLIAIPEDSMGVSVEIGWASMLGIDTIVFVDKKYKQSELVKSIPSVVKGKRVDIDSTDGYYPYLSVMEDAIKEYILSK